MLERILLYFISLVVYIAWLIYAIKTDKLLRFPIISSCFVGLFLFNVLGSIFIIFPDIFGRKDFFSYTYILMLNLQAIIFYFLTSIYFYLFSSKKYSKRIYCKKIDSIFLSFILFLLVISLLFFLVKVGKTPLLGILSGQLSSRQEIISYRTQAIYSSNSTLSSLVFEILPMLAGTYAFLKSFIQKKYFYYNYLIISFCVFISALPGGKGSILDIVIALFFAYLLIHDEQTSTLRKKVFNKWTCFWFCIAFIPVFFLYNVYYGSQFTGFEKLKLLLYRIVGVYSESLAATVAYTETYGFLKGNTLPNIKGILTHEPIYIGKEMHIFVFGATSGNAPISAIAEGYVNFGLLGFILFAFVTFIALIVIQEIFRSLPRNLFTVSLIVIYCVLATKVAQTGLFSTLVSLTYTMLFSVLFVIRAMLITLLMQKQWGSLSKTSKITN